MARFPAFADTPGVERRLVKYRPQGVGAPIKDKGNNVAVARTGVGVHTLTWSDKPKGFVGIQYAVGNSLAHDVRPVGAGYDPTTGVLTVTTFADRTTGAAAADIAANAANIIWLWAFFDGDAKI